MAEQTEEGKPSASGVDELIARLREEGVEAGRKEADNILDDARNEARQLLDAANTEARANLEKARKEADAYRAAGEAALRTAMRDLVLEMKNTLSDGFSTDVKRLVSRQLQNPEVLKQMILEVVGRVRKDADPGEEAAVTVVLPEAVIGLDELRRNPEAIERGPLTDFVFGLTREMLQDGVTFSTSEDMTAGIRIQLQEKNLILDLTDGAIATLLLAHLQPRFRAILEGVIK